MSSGVNPKRCHGAAPIGDHRKCSKFFGKVNEHIEGLRVDSDEYLDADSSVVVLGWVRGTARRSGVPFAVRLAHVWKVRDGKIVWFYNFVDTAALLAAIGEGSKSVREN
jgi:ketosteroid isomerase-like protein